MKKKNIIKISIIAFSVLIVLVLAITTTQSYFNKDNYANNPTEYQTGLLSIEASSKSNNISLSNTLPMSDTEGEQTEPYVFTIKNNGNVDYKFNIKLLSTNDNTFSPEYIKVKVDDDGIRTLSSLTDSIIKKDVILPAGETVDITLRVWLSSDTKNTQIGKTFNSKIVIDGQSVYTSTNQEIQTYTLEYDTGGGTTIPSESVTAGNELTLSSVTPKKSGYTFKGWSTSSTATAASYHPGQTITVDQNTKLYAVWEAESYNLTFVKEAGISTIYYSILIDNAYISTTTTKTISVNAGMKYYYYGVASSGYIISTCTSASPCSGTMDTSAVSKTLSASAPSSGSYAVTVYRKLEGDTRVIQLTSTAIASGKSFSYNFPSSYNTNYSYQSISCTNNQTPKISIQVGTTNKTLTIASVTKSTECTITYKSNDGTVIS